MTNVKLVTTPPRLKAPEALRTLKHTPHVRARMSATERESLILGEAVKFFSEFGFAGDTRELARRAHVTHPLLYKYFSTKEALIERVYESVYLGRWKPEWEALITNRELPVRERMLQFYLAFSEVILNREWVRLFMFFGLRGADINERWFSVVRHRVVLPLTEELRHGLGLPTVSEIPPHSAELELIQGISTRIFAFGIREYIYGMPMPEGDNVAALIESEINVFFDGIGPTLKGLMAKPVSRATRGRKQPSQIPT